MHGLTLCNSASDTNFKLTCQLLLSDGHGEYDDDDGDGDDEGGDGGDDGGA